MKYQYKFCSNCAELFDKKSDLLYVCPKCDFRIFVSPKPAVGALIFNESNELLLLKRSIEPAKGKFGLCGGFIDPDETNIEALHREVYEETKIKFDDCKYFGSYTGDYDYMGISYKVVVTYFTVKISNAIKIELSDESSEFKFVNIKNINLDEIGVDGDKKAITELIQTKRHLVQF